MPVFITGSDGSTTGSGGSTTYSSSYGHTTISSTGSFTIGSGGTTEISGGGITISSSSPALTITRGDLSVGGYISGSGTLEAVGNTFLGGTLNVSGNVALGDTAADVTTVTGQLTASHGGYFADRVGIGTATPARGVHIYGAGTQRIVVESSDSQAGVELKSDSADSVILYTPDASDGLNFHMGGASVVKFSSAGAISGSGTLQVVGNATLGGNLNVSGAHVVAALTNTTVKTNGTYSQAASDYYIGCDSEGGDVTINLQGAAAAAVGRVLVIKDETGTCTGSNTITVNRAGSDTIDGAASQEINNGYGSLTLLSTGAGWAII